MPAANVLGEITLEGLHVLTHGEHARGDDALHGIELFLAPGAVANGNLKLITNVPSNKIHVFSMPSRKP